jgi:hypothetical protein
MVQAAVQPRQQHSRGYETAQRRTSGRSERGLASVLTAAVPAAECAPLAGAGAAAGLSTSKDLQKPMQWLVSWSKEGATCGGKGPRAEQELTAGACR